MGNAALVVAANYGDCVVNISGGTFSSLKNAAVLDNTAGSYKAQISVSGGDFSDFSFVDYIAENAKASVTLNKDVELADAVILNSTGSELTVNLNGKNIINDNDVKDGDYIYTEAFIVKEGTLNIKGEGSVKCVANSSSEDGYREVITAQDNGVVNLYIMELKRDQSPDIALKQIEAKAYDRPFLASGKQIIKLGINFSSETGTIDGWAMA